MDDLLAARSAMGVSLAFHIIFAAIGMIMPLLMSTAHFLYLRGKNPAYLELTQLWLKGVAIFFAVGAVSGTVLSFELGLLWPGFMQHAGPIIGMPFSYEGTAFFLEAVAIGMFLYGWKRMRPWAHWATGLTVGISGFASGIFVVAANSWMNSPAGFEWKNGVARNIDPVAAMFNRAWLHQSLHMQLAALEAVGFAVAGIHALLHLRGRAPELNLRAIRIAVAFGAVAAIAQPLAGHFAGHEVARLQPTKLAALEGHFATGPHAPLYIGGWPDVQTKTVRYGIPLPGMLSFVAFNDVNAVVPGLDQTPRADWPHVAIVHVAFQIMVMIGMALAALGIVALVFFRRATPPRWYLRALVVSIPLGVIAIEAGWMVTELGRQPWIINGIMRTKDAVTPVPGMFWHFCFFLATYIVLSLVTLWLFHRQLQAAQRKFDSPR